MQKPLSLTAGLSNLFNKRYDLPLGGVYLPGLQNTGTGPLQPLAGYGRSIDLGIALKF